MFNSYRVWRLHLSPCTDSADDPNQDRSQFCLTHGLAGIGWGVPFDLPDWPQYCTAAQTEYEHGFGTATTFHDWVAVNDLVWTRDWGGVFHLGRITGDWMHRDTPEYRAVDIRNIRPCEWFRVGAMQDVPGALRNAFIRGRALQLIQSPTLQRYSVEVMNERAGQPVYQPPRVDPHLFTLLDPDGLEDLLGIYLQHKEGWIIYPSTSKINSPKYEYILFNPRTRRHGAVQVKQSTTQPLLVEDYLNFRGDVFLFQSANLYSSTPDKDHDHVHLIDPGMLERFCFDNLWLMPPSIRKWVDWKIARR